jgi:selenocysteine-specific elongation factor
MWLSRLPVQGHRELTVQARLLAQLEHPVRHNQQVHLYHGTSHTQARLALFETGPLQPGGQARVLLRLDEPLLAKRGDRILLRDQGLDHTLGGGVVLANQTFAGRLRDPQRQRWIDAFAEPDPAASLTAALAIGRVDLAEFAALWNLPLTAVEGLASRAGAERLGTQAVRRAQLDRWRGEILAAIRRAAGDATASGLKANEIAAEIPPDLKDRLLSELVTRGQVQVRAGRFDLPDRRSALSATERALLERIRPALDSEQPAALGDIAKRLQLPLPQLQRALKPLESKGVLIRISPSRALLPETLDAMADLAEALARQPGQFTVKAFRDQSGYGRNLVIEVLEYFDSRGFTRRNGDARVLIGTRERLLRGT